MEMFLSAPLHNLIILYTVIDTVFKGDGAGQYSSNCTALCI